MDQLPLCLSVVSNEQCKHVSCFGSPPPFSATFQSAVIGISFHRQRTERQWNRSRASRSCTYCVMMNRRNDDWVVRTLSLCTCIINYRLTHWDYNMTGILFKYETDERSWKSWGILFLCHIKAIFKFFRLWHLMQPPEILKLRRYLHFTSLVEKNIQLDSSSSSMFTFRKSSTDWLNPSKNVSDSIRFRRSASQN